jgi:hypothetical protein
MGTLAPLAPHWAANRSAMHDSKVEHALKRFHRRYRTQVNVTAQQHVALADLALTFPAMLFVMSVPHRSVDPAKLKPLVTAGAPLKLVSKQACLPQWTRKLPPEAFAQPLTHLPQLPTAALQIVNHMPKRARLTARWLQNVVEATNLGDDSFAVWVAREFGTENYATHTLRKMALWAWFSVRPNTAAHKFVVRPWRPEIKRKAAFEASNEFFSRLKLHILIADAVLESLWIDPQVIDGFSFLPLLTAADIHHEARIMANCIRSYGADIAQNQQRLWSVRREGKSIATLSIGRDYDLGLLTITQIKGPKNSKVSRDVAVAAYRWFQTADVLAIDIKEKEWDELVPNPKAWASVFKPYWREKRRIPAWLPIAPTFDLVDRL